jgi:hypothetical protein
MKQFEKKENISNDVCYENWWGGKVPIKFS